MERFLTAHDLIRYDKNTCIKAEAHIDTDVGAANYEAFCDQWTSQYWGSAYANSNGLRSIQSTRGSDRPSLITTRFLSQVRSLNL